MSKFDKIIGNIKEENIIKNSHKTLAVASIIKFGESEDNIRRLLESVIDIADVFISVTYDDKITNELQIYIAKLQLEYKFHLQFIPWEFDFAKARNEAIKFVNSTIKNKYNTYEWILFLDADERLSDPDNKLISILENTDKATHGYLVNILSWRGENQPPNDHQCRLFRNRPEYKYENVIHEQIIDSILNVGKLILPLKENIAIDHYGYSDLKLFYKKMIRDLKMLDYSIENFKNPLSYYFRATMYFQYSLISQAYDDILRAIDLIEAKHPSRLLILNRGSQIAMAMRNENKALELAEESISFEKSIVVIGENKNPGQVFPRIVKGDILLYRHKPEFAVQYFKEALTNLRKGAPQPDFAFSEPEILQRINICEQMVRSKPNKNIFVTKN